MLYFKRLSSDGLFFWHNICIFNIMKKLIYILALSIGLFSCALSNNEIYKKYDVIVDGKTYKNVHIVNHEEGLIVFTHNMKSHYYFEGFKVIER